ncbi:AcrB/AcrD/AcrF family protein, partial [Aliarcobacter butzleri]|nr:AcrB/AcrD/AcrF family protein [Aliarcobacter butzleri]
MSNLRKNVQEKCSLYEANIKFIELPAGPPVLASIVAEIYGGNNFESRRDFSLKVTKIFKNQTTLVDIDVLADEEFITYDVHINSNKANMRGVDLEHLKATLFLALEGIKISVINDKNIQSQIPIFIRLDESRNLEKNSRLA